MKEICFMCGKELGWNSKKYDQSDLSAHARITKEKMQLPSGMTEDDRICYDDFVLLTEPNPIKVADVHRTPRQEEIAEMRRIVVETKKNWNKYEVVEYYSENVVILQRMWGQQVEFIAAYDQVTKEGYRLMAIDEGKTAGGVGMTGGINAYFYFQKAELISGTQP